MISILLVLMAFLAFSSANDQKVVCYFGNWAVYRPGHGNFGVEDINPMLCTHLIYSFVGINETDGSIIILDHLNDIEQGGYQRFNALKKRNPNLKTLIAIGGWNEGSIKYSKVAASKLLRKTFINNAVRFVTTHGFDGFDLDWEYPGQRGGSANDKENFGLLVKEFREEFDKHGLLITAAVGASLNSINLSYNVPVLSKYLHFINVMTYDLHGSWDRVTGQNAPLYASSIDKTPSAQQLNVAACIRAWINHGAAPEKLILGVGTYGRSFTLDDPSKTGLGSPASQPGAAGPYTRENGMLGYNEICEMQQQTGKWKFVWDEEQKVPYSYRENQWVGYDDPKSISYKVEFAKQMKLGGLMVWSIETDDFRGICGRQYPLLYTINSEL